MNRWWASRVLADDALSRVDATNTVQGVGTAMLGLHAIAADRLAPLATQTLVDPADVVSVLADIDLEPVSKALTTALETDLGAAAPHYAQALTERARSQAADGMHLMLTSLRGSGLAMPAVLERSIEAVGLPPGPAGAYLVAARVPGLREADRKDAADRALMSWAARSGELEARSTEIGKDAAFEAAHPREDAGRFADKPVGGLPPRQARQARRRRRVARNAAAAAVEQAPAAPAERSSNLASLKAMLRPERPRPERPRQERARPERARAERPRAERARAERPEEEKTPAPKHAGLLDDWSNVQRLEAVNYDLGSDQQMGVLVPRSVAQEIIDTGGFTAGHLMTRMHGDLASKTAFLPVANLMAGGFIIDAAINTDPDDAVLVVFSHEVPMLEHSVEVEPYSDEYHSGVVDPHAKFTAVHGAELNKLPEVNIVDEQHGLDLRRAFPALHVSLDNGKDYARQPMGKSTDYEEWAHRAVARDEEGQFAPAGGGRTPRERRRARRRRRMAHQADAAAPTLSELGAALRVERERPVRERAERERAERPRAERERAERPRAERERAERTVLPRAAAKQVPKQVSPKVARLRAISEAPPSQAKLEENEQDGTAKMMATRAVRMTLADARRHFVSTSGEGSPLDDLVEDRVDVAVAHGEEPLRGPFAGRFTHLTLPDIVTNYANEGVRRTRHTDWTSKEEAYAKVLELKAEARKQFANAPPGHSLSAYEPEYILGHSKNYGGFTALEVRYGEGEDQPLVILGDDEAMRALHTGAAVEMRVVARDSYDLADRFDADEKVLGNRAVPLVAIEVSAVHPESTTRRRNR